jgi:hypothetical protein
MIMLSNVFSEQYVLHLADEPSTSEPQLVKHQYCQDQCGLLCCKGIGAGSVRDCTSEEWQILVIRCLFLEFTWVVVWGRMVS